MNHKWQKGDVCLRCKLQRRQTERLSQGVQRKEGTEKVTAYKRVTVTEYSRDGERWYDTGGACEGPR